MGPCGLLKHGAEQVIGEAAVDAQPSGFDFMEEVLWFDRSQETHQSLCIVMTTASSLALRYVYIPTNLETLLN
jgi:hypothetical protein